MQVGMWDSLYNMLLLIFWFRIWNADDRDLFFNPYLAPLGRLSKSAVAFLRPVFHKVPDRLIATAAVIFLIAFRALAMPQDAQWMLVFGVQLQSKPGLPAHFCFSFLSFGMFLFTIWGISLIYIRTRKRFAFNHTTGALYYLSRPFTDLRAELRPAALLAVGIVMAALFDASGRTAESPLAGITLPPAEYPRQLGLMGNLMKSTIVTVTAWVQVLPVISSLLLLLIIGSWVAMFTSASRLMMLCKDWIDFLLGPLRRHPIRMGGLDLTPVIFFFVIGFVFSFLINILSRSYELFI